MRDSEGGNIATSFIPFHFIGLPRTNNISEGWNNAFLQMVKRGKRSIYDFIDKLKTEQNLVSAKIAKCKAGTGNRVKPKNDVVKREKNIHRIIADFEKQMNDFEGHDDDYMTDDENSSGDENDPNALNSQLSQNWLAAKGHAITNHSALVLINAIAHHTRV